MFAYLRNSIVLASLVVFIFLDGSSSSTRFRLTLEGYEVDAICRETVDHKFCLKILSSTPLTAESDIPGLGKFLVKYGQHNISDAIKQIESIVQHITDPSSKKVYVQCVEYLKWGSTYCDNSLKALEDKDKDLFIDSLRNASDCGETCGDSLRERHRENVGDLLQKIDAFWNACDIAIVIANELPETSV